MLSTTNEVWKDIEGYEGAYQVSSIGNIRSLDRYVYYVNHGTPTKLFCKGKVLKQTLDVDGYCRINLRMNGKDKGFGVHRLVAAAFIPNPDNLPQVNHIDGVKTNNAVENLEWCTPLYNNRHATAIGHRPKEMWDKIIKGSVEASSKPVKDITTGLVYSSMIEAERQLNLYSAAVWTSINQNRPVKGHQFIHITKDEFKTAQNAVNH